MSDKIRVSIIIENMETYIKELEEMKIRKLEDLETIKFRAASMDVFEIINKTIDLADEIVSMRKMGFPSEYKELFTMLRHAKIIDEKMEEKLKDLVILRNKISHRYNVLTKQDIFSALKKIKIVEKFIEIVKKFVREFKTTK